MNEDPFVLLQFPRRPLLSASEIISKFQTLAAAAHPDRSSGDHALFAALNAAKTTLSDPASRLREIIRLETGQALSSEKRTVPGGLEDLFARISDLTTACDVFLKKKQHTPGHLAKALLSPEEIALQESLQELRTEVESITAQLQEALVYVDSLWDTAQRPALIPELLPLSDAFAYVTRWKHQIDERLLLLIL